MPGLKIIQFVSSNCGMNLLDEPKLENQLASIVIDCAYEVYRNLGPGLLESIYVKCLVYELKLKGLEVMQEKTLPVSYKDQVLDSNYRVDILVNSRLIVELKATETINEVHYAQLLTYLKLSKLKLGLLLNFNTAFFKSGIRRVVNRL